MYNFLLNQVYKLDCKFNIGGSLKNGCWRDYLRCDKVSCF